MSSTVKSRKLFVEWRNGGVQVHDYYIVKKVVNSTEWRPGQSLSKQNLDDILKEKNIEVTIS